MKILYIHQYFKTPEEPGGTRSFWIARRLIEDGHSVTLITGRSAQRKKITKENIQEINVLYVRNKYDNSFGIFRRLLSFIEFLFVAIRLSFREKDVDLVYSTSTPLTVGIPAILLKIFKDIPYIFEVRDLWPEVPIQMGAFPDPVSKWLSVKLEKTIYKKSCHVIALSPGMKEGIIEKGVAEDKVSMVPNMAKIDKFYLRDSNVDFMSRLDLSPTNFHVLHFGTLGIANGVEYIIKAAEILNNQQNNNIVFLFAGGGSQVPRLIKYCNENNITNVKFLGSFNMNDMSELVNIVDCSVVSFANIPILKTNSPNKLFDSLSAQKPIIVNSAGWTKDLVEKNNCGAYVDPEHPDDLANLVLRWSKQEYNEVLLKMGVNSRRLAEDQYDKKLLTKKVSEIVKRCGSV